MSRGFQSAMAVLIPIAVVSACLFFVTRSRKPEAGNLYAICETCELSHDDVDKLIRIVRESGVSREGALDLFRQTLDDPAKVDCVDCAEAILDAAGVE